MKLHMLFQTMHLGSIDINRGDTMLGWDTDQFPNNPADLIMSFYFIFKNGGLRSRWNEF